MRESVATAKLQIKVLDRTCWGVLFSGEQGGEVGGGGGGEREVTVIIGRKFAFQNELSL